MHHDDDDASHHQGLARDLRTMIARGVSRRQLLGILGGATLAVPLIGCLGDDDSGTSADAGASAGGPDAAAGGDTCAAIPTETAGPYPGDGTNGPNALQLSGIVRSDIRSSIGSASGVAAGVPLTVKLKLVDVSAGCAALAGHAIYLWHCDRDGNYSMYSAAAASENYLRGVQVTDADGFVTFQTIFPGCYSGRWPHIHFEMYPSVSAATSGNGKEGVSQLALPKDSCDAVYATSGYSASVSNLSQTSLTSDMVFRDGVSLQLPTMSGNPTDGYTAVLTVGI